MMRLLLLPLLLLFAGSLHAQRVRVMTYNVLQFSAFEDGGRVAALRAVVDSVAPDILCVQEIQGSDGFFAFNKNVAQPAKLSPGGFIDNDQVFFNAEKLGYIDVQTVPTSPQETHVYTLHVCGTSDTIDVVIAHLRKGDTPDAREERRAACASIRTYLDLLPARRHHIVLGDFGMLGGEEPGYTALTRQGTPGSSFDLAQQAGHWSGNNAQALLHTSSTRTTSLGDGGSLGGMTDRFDMILLSPSLLPFYEEESYHAVGQDGRHFGTSLNNGVNEAVSPQLAEALYVGSDHLPVVVDLQFGSSSVERRSGVRGMNLTQRRR